VEATHQAAHRAVPQVAAADLTEEAAHQAAEDRVKQFPVIILRSF